MSTLLGFDFGQKKIGVAVGQTITGTATPLTTLRNRGRTPDWPAIEALIREWQPDAAVVGLPHNMDECGVRPSRQFAAGSARCRGRSRRWSSPESRSGRLPGFRRRKGVDSKRTRPCQAALSPVYAPLG
jgi:hypothetical protein